MVEAVPRDEGALVGVRVIDLTAGPLAGVARMLADLGADVVRVEPRGGGADRNAHPVIEGVSLAFAAANLGKAAVALDLLDRGDRKAIEAMVAAADIVIEDTAPGSAASAALDAEGLTARYPELVVVSISNFGQSTSYAAWQATTPVLLSLSGLIARSGIEGRPPLLPPGDLAMECAIPQAAVVTLLAFYNRLLTGRGDHLDFSLLDAASQVLDPGFGMTGSASGGATPSALPRGRPALGRAYPIIPCGDGFVRLCVLSPRQWQGLFEWMGRPEAFADPAFNGLAARFQSPTLIPAITRFFAGKPRAQLEAEGQRFGVPAAAVLSLDEAVESEHARARQAFSDVVLAPGLSAPFPNGVMEIDGRRAAAPRTVPTPSDDRPERTRSPWRPAAAGAPARPLEGLRILDLGVIVVGGEQGRLLADQGAEVIKIESLAYPDGARQLAGGLISPNFAAGNRNKQSFGLNLRDPRGKALFLELAGRSDVILSNFKPGTLQSLGLDAEVLHATNPRLIMVDSSAFGSHGPWSRRLGYGPLVRAGSGLTALWRYADDPHAFSDSVTIYPDHVAARVGVLGVLALLIRRRRTGRGGALSVSQSEVMMSHMATRIAGRALARAGRAVDDPEYDAPWGMFACAGDDDWCAITVRNDRDWLALCKAIDRADLAADAALADRRGRDAARTRIDAAVVAWTGNRTPAEAMSALQAAGVPAGAMHRVTELPHETYYRERGFFRSATHPHLAGDFLVEARMTHAKTLPDPPLAPAPLMGQQTRALAHSILGLTAAEIDQLVDDKVLEAPEYPPPA
jgi:crotonobetainyl-CoA:carnitine CoA-transferase CaiB-like acyl-CoA transferase